MRRLPAFVLAGLAVAMLVPAQANHLQSEGGRVVAFDHWAGNSHWVEVRLSGEDAGSVEKVEVGSRHLAWTPMQKTSWGTWALNQYMVPGEPVRFLATWPGGVQVASCAFSHPEGVEGCGPPSFTADFHDAKGNAWWVQVGVYPNQPLAGVDVQVDGGAWKPLKLQPWGSTDWAASHYAPQGARVQFRAVSQSGGVALSGCYQWTSAVPMGCDGTPPPPPPPPGFDATFGNVQGNQWWVQLTASSATTGHNVQKVEVRLGCTGDWRPLTARSYGWAASYNVPAGTKVDFRATSGSGAVDLSDGYIWPQQVQDGENEPAAKTAPC